MSVKPSAKKRLADGNPAQTVTYTYAYDGSRLSKTVGKTSKSDGTKTEYILNGSLILAQNITYPNGEKETLNFYYSSDGKLLEIGYLKGEEKENHYSVIRNAMGDVTALYTADGTLVGTYEYDPYGLPFEPIENKAYVDNDGILEKNPFRYRGYYYDQETEWYYLQSRYYDPQVKRFVNADSTDLLVSEFYSTLQYNLFIYCEDNPIGNSDPTGYFDGELWVAFCNEIEASREVIAAEACFSQLDSPVPGPMDLLAACMIVGTIGVAAYNAYTSTKENTETIAISIAETDENKQTLIYRHGGTNIGNLVPSKKDVAFDSGLSFSTVPEANSWVTTMEAVNSTECLIAIKDTDTHVTVYPVGGTVAEWRAQRDNSIWTKTLSSISVKIKKRLTIKSQ